MRTTDLIAQSTATLITRITDRLSIHFRLDGLDFGEADVAPDFSSHDPQLPSPEPAKQIFAAATPAPQEAAAATAG